VVNISASPGGFPRGRPALKYFGVVLILRCSAKGCAETAAWALRWNNPKLHTPDRRKIWLACENHRNSLSTFLSARGFLRDVVPASTIAADDLTGPPDTTDGG
jgi:hypothetical protein